MVRFHQFPSSAAASAAAVHSSSITASQTHESHIARPFWKRSLSYGLTLLALLCFGSGTAQVWISEFLADNTQTLADSDGDFSDWVELESVSSESFSLNGYHLADEEAVPTKWQFPAVEIAPRSRLVVFASGKNRSQPGAELHTNFRLSKNGGFLALIAPDRVRVIQNDPLRGAAPGHVARLRASVL